MKTKAFLNSVILLLCLSLAIVAVVAYGKNPLTVPIVRVSVVTGQCLSAVAIVEGKEVEKSCDFFDQMRREKKRYEIQYVK